MIDRLIAFIRDQYGTTEPIPLHAPTFGGREKQYVVDAIESTFVSSAGAYVDRFEGGIAAYTGAERAVAVVNGTAALHTALILAGVAEGDLVVTQALTFVATCNAIAYCRARPLFIDVDRARMGLSPPALHDWLAAHADVDDRGVCRRRADGCVIRAAVVMHTFGHPADLDGLMQVCARWGIFLIEDAAEALGSLYKQRHTGTIARVGALSFNGNKIITTGGGGAILANTELGAHAKHLTTTAKRPHAYEFFHDEIGYNYRMPNLNAALGCAQLEQLDRFVAAKRTLSERYRAVLAGSALQFVDEPADSRSNFWLIAVLCSDRRDRDSILKATNERGVMTRPVWTLMTRLPMFADCPRGDLSNSTWLEERLINLPSSVPEVGRA
jgi:aminotransferase in exopolysaccharide biosynthesis